jgi:5'-nucleotidase/UDP-sugar diphosphatase
MRTQRLLIIILLLIGFFFPSVLEARTQLTILHTSEHHGTALPDEDGMGGLAYLATVIKEIRAKEKNVLLLNSGDLLVGTLMSTVFRGVPDVLAMNLMRYDAVTIGNHEFDFGLMAFQNLRDLARFPFLSANIQRKEITPSSSNLAQPWMIREFDGLKVGVFGLTTVEAREIMNPSVVKQITILGPIPVAHQVISTLRQQVDLIIALTHQDNADDIALAKAVPEIDVIIGGHTEGFDGILTINPSTTPVSTASIKELENPSTIYVKTHRQGKTLGRLDLVVENGKILKAKAENIPINSRILKPDEEVARLLKIYSDQLNQDLKTVIGKTQVELNGERDWIRSRESNLGNFIADMIRSYTQTDISFINAGAIRASIKKGDITLGDLYRVYPFLGNTLVTFKITGADIREALENSVSQVEKGAGRFLQVSGLTYTYNARAPLGKRILEVKVNGIPLMPDHLYKVATTNYLAEGGDGYVVFLENRKEYQNTHLRLIDLLKEYIQKQGVISPQVEGRILEK